MLSTHSKFGDSVRIVVSPCGARNVIGCVTRKVRKHTTPASASRMKASVSSVPRSRSPRCHSAAYATTAATTISAASGARFTREASAMPKNTPNSPYHSQVWL